MSRLHPLTSVCVLGNAGCWTDMTTLLRTLEYDIKELIRILKLRVRYKYNHREEISTSAVATLLSNTLYNRRFFPIYAFNVLCGLDENGMVSGGTEEQAKE